MASGLEWLSKCKLTHLRAIAIAIGVNSSGTKGVMIPAIGAALQRDNFAKTSPRKQTHRILSIDMGIRNLSFCEIFLPAFAFTQKDLKPIIQRWDRIAVTQTPDVNEPLGRQVKEMYDPLTYSKHAYDLLRRFLHLADQAPDHILIERQRFRTMGGANVQEWTLRVNMFEGMLYAVLKTLQENGQWNGTVYSVLPKKVSTFWLQDREVDAEKENQNIKTEKIKVVDELLKNPNAIFAEGQAVEVVAAWRARRPGEARKSKKPAKVTTKLGKLDDLADSLLQGLAWVRWEQNRRAILLRGLDAIS